LWVSFFLQANPGAWLLQLREGKSKETYDIVAHSNSEGDEGSAVRVLIDSFSGRTIRIYVSKRKGLRQTSFPSDENENGGGIWDSFSGRFLFLLSYGHFFFMVNIRIGTCCNSNLKRSRIKFHAFHVHVCNIS
ncbi:hypothetical protein COOONC_28009, partial [Cooperia oncophora]